MAHDWSLRAVFTGALIGAVLSLCNVYTGLKIGWSSNMSITGSLIAFAVWQIGWLKRGPRGPFTILETNLSQAACSAAAAVSSAGLVAGVPALTMLTGIALPWPQLAAWIFSVCLVGIVIAVPIRRQMIEIDPLPFPMGIAAAETLKQMYARGAEAMARVQAMGVAGLVAGALKPLEHFKIIPSLPFPGAIGGYSLKNLTFALDPSLLLVAAGGLMGTRACASIGGGALLAYGAVAPWLLSEGLVVPGPPDRSWFKELVGWLLWPGVTCMVLGSLTSFAMSWRSIGKAFAGLAGSGSQKDGDDVPASWFKAAFAVVLVLSVFLQIFLFGIPLWAAGVGVLLSFALGIVAARVTGETGVTPVGAMGKVTQLVVGVGVPGDVSANLMCATVSGGAASQCADLMADFKTGKILGSSPRSQWLSQIAGALAGSMVGTAIYLLLIPDPASQLLTPQWAAPAVATWKAVAEVFKVGLSGLPPRVEPAIAIAAVVGIGLAVLAAKGPERIRKYVPSASALGLGFTVPFNQSFSMVLGGLAAIVVSRRFPRWHDRLWIAVCAGAVAGESLVGVGLSIREVLKG